MTDLMTEIAIYLGIAAFLGFLLGFLIWGWGARSRLEAARAEGAARARTSVDGDSALRTELSVRTRERDQLEKRVRLLTQRLSARGEAEPAQEPAAGRARNHNLRVVDAPGQTTAPGRGVVAIHGDAATHEEPAGDGTLRRDMERYADMLRGQPRAAPPGPETTLHVEPMSLADLPPLATLARPRGLLAGPPAESDDLTAVDGIDAGTAAAFNEAGIYHFRQIARLTHEHLDWLKVAVTIAPSLTQIDAMADSAMALHRQKYGDTDLDDG